MSNKEALESISKSLFTASEALREVLDIADLHNVDIENWNTYFETTKNILEKQAQYLQKKARS